MKRKYIVMRRGPPDSQKIPGRHPLDKYAETTGGLRRAAEGVFMACETGVAEDISQKLLWAANEIEFLRAERTDNEWYAMLAKAINERDDLRAELARFKKGES